VRIMFQHRLQDGLRLGRPPRPGPEGRSRRASSPPSWNRRRQRLMVEFLLSWRRQSPCLRPPWPPSPTGSSPCFVGRRSRSNSSPQGVADLEARLGKTSATSSRPPSTDHPHTKPCRPKPKSHRPRGGQLCFGNSTKLSPIKDPRRTVTS